MFNIFSRKFENGVLVVSESEFWKRIEAECTDLELFNAQGDEHGDIDMRLVEKIENYLVPIIGQWEGTSNWFHQMDYHGDGIRSLSFSLNTFKREFIEQFQSFLVGEHKPFCILCQLHEDLESEENTKLGSLAIFSDRLMVSKNVAKLLSTVA